MRDRGEKFVLGPIRDLRLLARLAFAGEEQPIRLLDALLLVDVRRRADPAHDAPVVVALGHQPAEVPAPFAVLAPQALLAVHRLAGADCGAVGPADLLGVLVRHGVEERHSRIVAGVLAPDAVAVVDLAVGAGRPDALRHGIGEDAEAQLSPLLHLQQVARPQHRLLLAEQLVLAPEIHEDRHLGAQDLRVERLEQIVDRAFLVTAEDVRRVLVYGGEEDDGDVPVAPALLDQLGGLDAVEPGHLHVHQDQGEVRLEQVPQRLLAGMRVHQLLGERLEDGCERHQIRRMVVDHEDARRWRIRLEGPRAATDDDRRRRWGLSVHHLAHSLINSSSLSASTGFGR